MFYNKPKYLFLLKLQINSTFSGKQSWREITSHLIIHVKIFLCILPSYFLQINLKVCRLSSGQRSFMEERLWDLFIMIFLLFLRSQIVLEIAYLQHEVIFVSPSLLLNCTNNLVTMTSIPGNVRCILRSWQQRKYFQELKQSFQNNGIFTLFETVWWICSLCKKR